MRILFLDDDKNRFLEFSNILGDMLRRKEISNIEVKYAMNAKMAKEFLINMATFDIAFLDHDLGPEHYGAPLQPGGDDGRSVVRFIIDTMAAAERPRRFHVHSWNYDGAKEMEISLQKAGLPCTRAMFPRGIQDVLGAVGALMEGEKKHA